MVYGILGTIASFAQGEDAVTEIIAGGIGLAFIGAGTALHVHGRARRDQAEMPAATMLPIVAASW